MNNERLYKVILGAHISEKASVIADEVNQFAFKVAKDATGPEIREAVEKIYDVEVKKVSVINSKGFYKYFNNTDFYFNFCSSFLWL